MNPRYLPAAGAFVAALLVGAFAADALRSDKVSPVLPPVVADELVPVLPVVPIAAEELEASLDPSAPWIPVEVAAELVPVDRESVPGGSDRGPEPADPGFGDPAAPGEEAAPGAPVTEGDSPPPDPGFDFLIGDLELPELFFGIDPIPWHRFFDYCADAPEDADCPAGVGATVLVDYDGPGEPGPFEIVETLYPRAGWWRCEDPGRLRTGQYQIMILATHPSRMEISYHPALEPDNVTTVVVDTSTPPHPELGQWLELMATYGGPAVGQNRVQHCFVLDGGRASRSIVIEASATSLTGDTATRRFTFRTDETRRRPPVTVAPLSDYEATVAMPFQNDGNHTSVLRVIDSTEDLDCSDIERAAIFDGGRGHVVPPVEGGYSLYSGFASAEPMGDEFITAPDWPYDPSYDTYHFWNLNLREGRAYLICMWWVRSAVRSFDDATIVERESRWVITPDRNVTRIRVNTVRASSRGSLAAEAITVAARCFAVRVPSRVVARDEIVSVFPSEGLLCDYNGYEQPEITEVRMVTTAGDEFTFAVPTPSDAPLGSGIVTVNLDVERTSGLCGSSFGPCDPPTTVYPGPQVTLLVETYAGEDNGWTDWFVRGPETFEPPPLEPVELPLYPQLDLFGSGLTAEGRDRMRVDTEFDRPVRLTAVIRGSEDDPCLGGTTREIVIAEFRNIHTFWFDGLCTLREYAVDLTVTDEAGTTVVYGTNPTAEGTVWLPWYGWGNTDGWPVRFIVGLRSSLVGDYYSYRSEVQLIGSSIGRIDLRPDNRCLTGVQSREQVAEWRETVTIQIDIGFYDGMLSDGTCRSTRYGREWTASVVAEFSIEEFRAGRIVIPVTVTDPDGRPLAALSISINGRVGP